MEILSKLNSPVMYCICGGIVLSVAVLCILFALRAYRAGKAIGMDTVKMKRAVIASATFAILPSVGILLGVIALSGSLGTPWPWLRLSVIGALHYETQVAETAAEAVGLTSLSASQMTPMAFSTIALLMSMCIIWGPVMVVFHGKSYTRRLSGSVREKPAKAAAGAKKRKLDLSGFGDKAMTAMFIGLVSAYIGSYIGTFLSGNGILALRGSPLPLLVAVIAAAAMRFFLWIREKYRAEWVDSFSIAGSMLVAMSAAALLAGVV